MTISISEREYEELLFQQTVETSQHPDPNDALDIMYQYPKLLGEGYWRVIELRSGLELSIGDLQLCDCITTEHPEHEEYLEFHFHFSGQHEDCYASLDTGHYYFAGSGLIPERKTNCYEKQPFLEIDFFVQPELMRSFAGNSEGQLPKELQHLIRKPDEPIYYRKGTATQTMQKIGQQILHCHYQSVAKRIYLESKVLELLGILILQEIDIHNGNSNLHPLRPDVIDRIHYAEEIILQKLDNPPSLSELARLVGLNECTLKRGFRYCFGTSVFSYMRNYKLEQARKMLEAGEMNITEIARVMGYTSRSPFAAAFRKQFGVNPKQYQKLRKSSV
jgi:AraC-like DNA-binding protein